MIKKSGFTLVELLMVMGILGILMTVLFQVFNSILTMRLRSEATTAVAQDSRYLIARLSYDVSRASNITSGPGNSLSLIIGGSTYTYSLQGTTLVLSVGGGSPQALSGTSTKVTSLNFERTDMGTKKSVQISLIIASTAIQPGGVTGERHLTTTVSTR